MRWALTAVVLALAIAGCKPRPRAPALIQGEPVYHNKQEGFRFMPPPNWHLHARSELPPGKFEVERFLVEYRRLSGPKVASLDVSMVDLSPSTTVESYLAEHGPGRESWQPAGKPETIDLGGKSGLRVSFKGQRGPDAFIKEIVAVRKGDRAYFFSGVYAANDAKARDQVRKAVESLTWDG